MIATYYAMASLSSGKIIETDQLYSEKTLSWLKQALELIQKNASVNQRTIEGYASTYLSRYADDSEDELVDEDESRSSCSSEDESSGDAKGNNIGDPDAHCSTSATSTELSSERRFTHRKKTITDDRQRTNLVRKHVESLNKFLFPIIDPKYTVLSLPAALLPKEEFQSNNALKACQLYLKLASDLAAKRKTIVVLFLRSGRFAGAVFQGRDCLAHRVLTRYTVRKGQGKAQSSQDSQRRAKSMGSQLRRAGEQSLREDMSATVKEWKVHFDNAALVMVSCPKTMRKSLFDSVEVVLSRDDARVRRVPLDLGRPTFENVSLIYESLLTVQVREVNEPVLKPKMYVEVEGAEKKETTPANTSCPDSSEGKEDDDLAIPLTALHVAAKTGCAQVLKDLLADDCTDINLLAGPDLMTPLHYAADSTLSDNVAAHSAAECITVLLIEGKANPGLVDIRHRPPYFLASQDKVRDAFRMARARLGESFCAWDDDAKVGPPLAESDLKLRKEKEAEKRRKKKIKQKEKKAKERVETEAFAKHKEEEEIRLQEEKEAKRIRDGLESKASSATNVCDFCQTVCSGRRRSQMLKRLDYSYCSSECVQKHKRELIAAAALSRFVG